MPAPCRFAISEFWCEFGISARIQGDEYGEGSAATKCIDHFVKDAVAEVAATGSLRRVRSIEDTHAMRVSEIPVEGPCAMQGTETGKRRGPAHLTPVSPDGADDYEGRPWHSPHAPVLQMSSARANGSDVSGAGAHTGSSRLVK